jgi:hypothetical protein
MRCGRLTTALLMRSPFSEINRDNEVSPSIRASKSGAMWHPGPQARSSFETSSRTKSVPHWYSCHSRRRQRFRFNLIRLTVDNLERASTPDVVRFVSIRSPPARATFQSLRRTGGGCASHRRQRSVRLDVGRRMRTIAIWARSTNCLVCRQPLGTGTAYAIVRVLKNEKKRGVTAGGRTKSEASLGGGPTVDSLGHLFAGMSWPSPVLRSE